MSRKVISIVTYWLLALAFCFALTLLPIARSELFCIADQDDKSGAPAGLDIGALPARYKASIELEYAAIIETGEPHEFSFSRAIIDYWQMGCTLKRAGLMEEGDARARFYQAGVGLSWSQSFKGLYEESFGRLFAWIDGARKTSVEEFAYDQARAYGSFLRDADARSWPYTESRAALWQVPKTSLRDWERTIVLGIGATVSSVFAKPDDKSLAPTELKLAQVTSFTLDQIVDYDLIEADATGLIIELAPSENDGNLIEAVLEPLAQSGAEIIEIDQQSQALGLFHASEPFDAPVYARKRQAGLGFEAIRIVDIAALSALLSREDGEVLWALLLAQAEAN